MRTDEEIRQAIHAVRRSRHNARVQAYSQAMSSIAAQGLAEAEQDMPEEHEIAVVVQRLVRADLSGVLFTADPVTGDRMRMTGNFVQGLGETLVSGQANAQTFTFRSSAGDLQRAGGARPPRAHALSQRLQAGEGTGRSPRHRMGGDKRCRRGRTAGHPPIAPHYHPERIQGRHRRMERQSHGQLPMVRRQPGRKRASRADPFHLLLAEGPRISKAWICVTVLPWAWTAIRWRASSAAAGTST